MGRNMKESAMITSSQILQFFNMVCLSSRLTDLAKYLKEHELLVGYFLSVSVSCSFCVLRKCVIDVVLGTMLCD